VVGGWGPGAGGCWWEGDVWGEGEGEGEGEGGGGEC